MPSVSPIPAGFHGDNTLPAWPYRDYVLRAFLDNKPFDQFTREQLAGDLFPMPPLDQNVASAYNRMNRTSAEGGLQPNEYLAKYGADRVRTFSTVWLGATMGCAECHDHKFDPFTSQRFLFDESFLRRYPGNRPGPGPGPLVGCETNSADRRTEPPPEGARRGDYRAHRGLNAQAQKLTEPRGPGKIVLAHYEAGHLAWSFQRPIGGLRATAPTSLS